MKVKSSEYLTNTRPLLKKLLNRLLESFSYASILAVDSEAYQYRVSKTVTFMGEDDLLCNRGFVIKVYDGNAYGEYSFNDISEEKIEDIVSMVKSVVALKESVNGMTLSQYKQLEDEPCTFCESTDYEIAPEDMGDEAILAKLTEIKDDALLYDKKILNATVGLSTQKYSKLFLSPNRDMEQNVMWACGMLMVDAKKDAVVKYSFKGFSNLGGIEIMRDIRGGIGHVGKNTLELLEASPIEPGEYDCICTPEVTGMIAHEAFGHGVEMDMFVKDRALAKSYVGKDVAAPVLTMHDGANMACEHEVASYFFDDEGVLSKDTVVIKDGVLQTGI